jgi:type IV secretion system protein VirB8
MNMLFGKKNITTQAHESSLSSISWEISIVEAQRRSAKLAWKIAIASLTIALLAITTSVIVLPLKTTEIKVVTVDKLTGETGLSGQLSAYALSPNELNDKYWTKRFLVARERYSYKILQADYDIVRLLAANTPWKNYSNLFEGANSLEKQYGADIEIIPTVLSSTISANSIATIRYELKERDLRNLDNSTQKIERRVATIRFHYAPNLKASERDLIENPFGFTVDSYQSVLEVAGTSPVQIQASTTK